MIVCASCGGQNDDGAAFCGDCGAFLEWVGAPEDDAAADATAAAPDEPAALETPEPEPVELPAEPPTATAEPATAAAGAATLADGSRVPAAVRPGEAVRRRPRRPPVAPPRPPAAGEVACPSCGTGNDRARRFCGSCGAALAAAPRERQGWWRRWKARRARRRTYEAGTRRRVRQPRRIPRKLVALGVVGALAAVAAGPGRDLITSTAARVQQEVRDQLAKPAPVTPTGWEASSALPEHGPDQLSTRVADQFWAPEGDPAGSWVEAELPRPVRLLHVVVHAGQSTDPELFQQQARPHEVAVTAISEDESMVTAELVVRDQPGPQEFVIVADQVVRVRFEFRSAHGLEPDRFMAVGEIEFFARG
jgi:hypothetical protein